VFLLTASRQNCNAASILLFLHRLVDVSRCHSHCRSAATVPLVSRASSNCNFAHLVCAWPQVFKHYFEELEEESLRDNFVVVVRGAFLCYVSWLWFSGNCWH
jgi:AP-1 complex subunit mu